MISRMNTYEIINRLGGPSQVARHLNITTSAVVQWSAKGRIPAGRVWALVALSLMVLPSGRQVTAADMRPDLFGIYK